MPYQPKNILRNALVLNALCLGVGTAHASTCRWVGPDNGAWNNASNWSTRTIPGTNDSVVIDAHKKVAVPANASIANLTVGEGAEVKNGAKIKVTGKTTSSGLFTGTGTLDVPVGAVATFNVSALGTPTATKNTKTAITFAPINNAGSIIASIARGSRVNFAALYNSGSVKISSGGTVAFKAINNTSALSISASGKLTLGKIDNAAGASLSVSTATTLGGRHVWSTDGDDPSVVYFDDLVNHPGGEVKLSGDHSGNYFDGDSIANAGQMQISGAQIQLESDVTNAKGATLTLDSGTTLSSSDTSALELQNAGDLIKSAGSDATLKADWVNSGHVIVESGTLHVQVPEGENCTQVDGVTSVEGGVFSIEDAQGLAPDGTLDVQGGIVNGIGTFDGNVINSGGHFKPGHSPGTITINGSWTQTSGGVLDMEVGGTTPGSTYDQMLVNGTAYLGGTLSMTRWDGFMPEDGDVYTLITYYSKSGNFANFADATPVTGITYDTTLTPTDLELNCYATPDTTAPTVSITSPVNGGAVRSITTATGTASDSIGVTGITGRLYRYANSVTGVAAGYWAGGSSWTSSAGASNERPASGTTSWTLTLPTMVAGRYSLRATAKDGSGNSSMSSTIAFWVDPNSPTSVVVTTPANGSTISTLSQISGTASDAADGSGVTNVSYQVKRLSDSTYWNGSAWTSTPYSFPNTVSGTSWSRSTPTLGNSTNLKPGGYSIIATATDRAGNTKTITSSFTVSSSSS